MRFWLVRTITSNCNTRYGRLVYSDMSKAMSKCDIALDPFAYRQFDDASYAGTKIGVSKEEFMNKVKEFYEERKQMQQEFEDRPVLIDGYAPFCKHLFVPNFDDKIVVGEIEITRNNEHLLRTHYHARKEGELPVLARFFPNDKVKPPTAKYLDLIQQFNTAFKMRILDSVYSREQILKERDAMGESDGEPLGGAPWRLIAVKGQEVPYEVPMSPITIMRNELISQGGSGVPIDRDAYMKSVEYWKDHAVVM